ncbi:MAG: hypothetical protein KAI70_05625 [Candidatus Omnitrophica bacterium]|nr:hypothetical protein [Candidatus Omnitrophota bacterium]
MKKKIKRVSKTFVKLVIAIVVPLGLIVAYGYASKSEWTSRRPSDYKDAVKINVGGAVRTYYSLYPDAPITLDVKGPARLRAITRMDFNTAISRGRPYEIKVYMDGSDEHVSFKKKGKPSFLSTFVAVNDKTPGKIRNIYFDVPEGRHTYVFYLETNKIDRVVRMRFLTAKESEQSLLEKKAKKWKFLMPSKYDEEVELYVEDNKRDYYRFFKDQPLEIIAEGPSLLKFLTRVEFNENMDTRCDYDIEVYEDGIFKTAQFFQTKKAKKVSYAVGTEMTAGRKREFIVEVPEGEHLYRIEMSKPKSVSVLCRPFVKIQVKLD